MNFSVYNASMECKLFVKIQYPYNVHVGIGGHIGHLPWSVAERAYVNVKPQVGEAGRHDP